MLGVQGSVSYAPQAWNGFCLSLPTETGGCYALCGGRLLILDVFSKSELRELVRDHTPPCVSIYLPTHAAGRAREQDDIRRKNLARDAVEKLSQTGIERTRAVELIAPVQELSLNPPLNPMNDGGIAIFSAKGFFRSFSMPVFCPEFALVGSRFHVTPLLPLLHANRRFFLLALTKDSADLYEATRDSLLERELPNMTPLEIDGSEQTLQSHSHFRTTQGRGTKGETTFHGHGGPDDREKASTLNFFKRQVDSGVSEALHDQQSPLVLACVDDLRSMYRQANSYPHLADRHVSGSPLELGELELRKRGWVVAEPLLHGVEQAARQRFEQLAGGPRTSTDLQQIAAAAALGRVDTLFVPTNIMQTAPTDKMKSQGDTFLREAKTMDAVEQTVLNSGQVVAVKALPQDAALAAILRY